MGEKLDFLLQLVSIACVMFILYGVAVSVYNQTPTKRYGDCIDVCSLWAKNQTADWHVKCVRDCQEIVTK